MRNQYVIFLAIIFLLNTSAISANELSNALEMELGNEQIIRVKFINEQIIRIQIINKKKSFKEPALNKYGFINESINNNPNVKFSKSKNGFTGESDYLKINGNNKTGEIIIADRKGNILLKQVAVNILSNLNEVAFEAEKSENWVGFGDQTRERLYHRGHIADCYLRNQTSYIPVPFFMSTLGVGVLVNTTRRVMFDMCKTQPDLYSWQYDSDQVDYYVFAGSNYKEILNLYTTLTGKPKLPPEWSLGLWYICRQQANDLEAVNDALNFRREGIPCDVIGLEPGWMDKIYDYSIDKKWSKERFPIASWAPQHSFISALKRMGFKFELWLCNDYDLSYCEERKIKDNTNNLKTKSLSLLQTNNNNDKKLRTQSTEKVINNKELKSDDNKVLSKNTSLAIKPEGGFDVDERLTEAILDKSDKITKIDEPWFEHLKKFVDQGADFFKQDASRQVNEHPNRLWGNSMTDAEMHNLYPLFYARQMYEGFKDYTNRRPVVFTPCGWTGFQSFSGTWTGDTGGEIATLAAMLNTSIVGHTWCTNDMEVTTKEGIHFGYLLPWSQINSWTYFRMPWIQGAELLAMHKYYGELRSKLIPYLYSWGYNASQTGWPLLVPLTLEFPNDLNCRENIHQYLLGRDLMVVAFNNQTYFPAGKWKNFWTGEVIKGQQLKEMEYPKYRGGGLYVRSGGIIPLGKIMQYRGEKLKDTITLYVFPEEIESSVEFYEDDGISFEFEKQKYAITSISTKRNNGVSMVKIGKSNGDFEGMLENRTWNIILHLETKPVYVIYNKKNIPENNYTWDETRKEITVNGVGEGIIEVTELLNK